MPEVTSQVAWAGSKILGRECASLNSAFLDCKANDPNPEACATLGMLVIGCGNRTFNSIRKNCIDQSSDYIQCLDDNRGRFSACRKFEKSLDACFDAAKATTDDAKSKVSA